MMRFRSTVDAPAPRTLPLVLALLLLGGAGGAAQTDDILLSSEPTEPVLAADGQIQSSGRIGSHRLAVWGTSESRAGEIVNTLRMQMLLDTALLGPQTSLCPEGARPYEFVQVVPLNRSFLVVWNDRRSGAAGTYARVVGLNGEGTPEVKIWDRGVDSVGMAVAEAGADLVLCWSDAGGSDGIYASRVDRNGARIGPAVRLSQGRLAGVRRPLLPAGGTVLDCGNAPPVVLGASGQIIDLAGARGKLLLPYFIDENGMVTTLQDNTVRQYRTILDSVPFRTIPVTIPAGAIRGSAIALSDSLGRIQILYNAGGGNAHGPMQAVRSALYRISEIAPGVFGAPSQLTGIPIIWADGHCDYVSAEAKGATVVRGPGNNYRIELTFSTTHTIDCSGIKETHSGETTVVYPINGNGGLLSGPFPVSSGLHPDGMLFRVPSFDASEVEVVAGKERKRLRASVHRQVVNGPQQSPMIQTFGGDILIGWLSAGLDTSALLARWQGGDRIEAISSLSLGGKQNTKTMFCLGGRMMLRVSMKGGSYDSTGRYVARDDLSYVAATPAGWKPFLTGPRKILGTPLLFSAYPEKGRDVVLGSGYDRNGDEIYEGLNLIGFDTLGRETWRIDSTKRLSIGSGDITSRLAMIPVGTAELVFIGDLTSRLTADTLVQLSTKGIPPNAVHLPMLGGRYLQGHIGNPVTLDLYDRNGVALHKTTLPPISASFPPYIVQNPADSGIAILYGGDGGVKLVTLDKELNVVDSTRVISATQGTVGKVVAAFKGDSLYVAWEDFRNSTADIYGRVVRARTRKE